MRSSYARNPDTGSAEVLDRNDYYAFGMNMQGYNSSFDTVGAIYNNKYNQKELQETGFYDYGWRQYMPDLGRWFGMDQLSEKYHMISTYAYAANNPVMFYDIDGRDMPGWLQNLWDASKKNEVTNFGGFDSSGSPSSISFGGSFSTENFTSFFNFLSGGGTGNFTFWTNGSGSNTGSQIQELVGNPINIKGGDVNTIKDDAYDWDDGSKSLRKMAGYGFTVSKMFEAGYNHASLYGKPAAYTTTSLYYEQKILGKTLLSIKLPFKHMNADKALKWAGRAKVAGTVLGAAGVVMGGIDIYNNGFTTSNTLDTTMSALAATPTGVTQGIAGAYFMLNFISTVTTGQDIGQHLDANGYNLGEFINEQIK